MFSFLSLVLLCAGGDGQDIDARALQKINACRQAADLNPVALAVDLSRACQAHAEYLTKNFEATFAAGLVVHDEDPKLPGYSADGKKAARASVISMASRGDPLIGVDTWIASFYHRIPLVDPGLTKVGIGFAIDNNDNSALVLDSTSGKVRSKENKVVCYPFKGQTDVPTVFCLGFPESPNPIPNNGSSKDAGNPITVTFFFDKAVITEPSATLTDDDGKPLAVWLSWPEQPAVKGYGKNTICLIPKKPLRPKAEYTVTVEAKVNGRAWKSTWTFRTGAR